MSRTDFICLAVAAFLLGMSGTILAYAAMQYATATVHSEADTED